VVRSFRLAATITASQLVSSWVGVEEVLTEARNTADMQRRAEESKRVGLLTGSFSSGSAGGQSSDDRATLTLDRLWLLASC